MSFVICHHQSEHLPSRLHSSGRVFLCSCLVPTVFQPGCALFKRIMMALVVHEGSHCAIFFELRSKAYFGCDKVYRDSRFLH
jgi:hypothetical protein